MLWEETFRNKVSEFLRTELKPENLDVCTRSIFLVLSRLLLPPLKNTQRNFSVSQFYIKWLVNKSQKGDWIIVIYIVVSILQHGIRYAL